MDNEQRTPVIRLSYKAYVKLFTYIKYVQAEVGGLGSVRTFGSVFVIDDIFLLEQEVTGATTDITGEGLAKFFAERKKADNPRVAGAGC